MDYTNVPSCHFCRKLLQIAHTRSSVACKTDTSQNITFNLRNSNTTGNCDCQVQDVNADLVEKYHSVCERAGTYPRDRYTMQLRQGCLCLHLTNSRADNDAIKGTMAFMMHKNNLRHLAFEGHSTNGQIVLFFTISITSYTSCA